MSPKADDMQNDENNKSEGISNFLAGIARIFFNDIYNIY